jgi:hypothetical protein
MPPPDLEGAGDSSGAVLSTVCPASTRGGGTGKPFGRGSDSSASRSGVGASGSTSTTSTHVPMSGRAKQLAYEPVCSHVADDFIFVGGLGVAHNQDTLREQSITHIVNCAGNSAANQFPDDFIYHTLLLHDHDSSDLSSQISHTISFIGE